jgi:hypothetical protein
MRLTVSEMDPYLLVLKRPTVLTSAADEQCVSYQYSETNVMHFLFSLLNKGAAPGLEWHQFHSNPGAAN